MKAVLFPRGLLDANCTIFRFSCCTTHWHIQMLFAHSKCPFIYFKNDWIQSPVFSRFSPPFIPSHSMLLNIFSPWESMALPFPDIPSFHPSPFHCGVCYPLSQLYSISLLLLCSFDCSDTCAGFQSPRLMIYQTYISQLVFLFSEQSCTSLWHFLFNTVLFESKGLDLVWWGVANPFLSEGHIQS